MKKIMDKAILTSAFILGAMKVGTTDAQALRSLDSDTCDTGCDQVKHKMQKLPAVLLVAHMDVSQFVTEPATSSSIEGLLEAVKARSVF